MKGLTEENKGEQEYSQKKGEQKIKVVSYKYINLMKLETRKIDQ